MRAIIILAPARDYKRIFDGDQGPNTGGMGAVARRQFISPARCSDRSSGDRPRRPWPGCRRTGLPYRGFLYFGLVLTAQGPKVIEYNCRFGDPECQAVMPLVAGDFAAYLFEGARGELRPDLIHSRDGWSVCVVLASAGYPASNRNGDRIPGLESLDGARLYHCGTRRRKTGNGKRMADACWPSSSAPTREAVVAKAHAEAARIDFDGLQRRHDIGRLHFE